MEDDSKANLMLTGRGAVIGFKQVVRAIEESGLFAVILAADTDEPMVKKITELCGRHGIELLHYSAKQALGRRMGIQVGCAVVGVRRKE